MKPPDTPLQGALSYAARGWVVFPCHTITPTGCSCGQADCHSPGKHPTTRTGLHAATSNRQQIRDWWRRHPDANVAIRTGTESGLVVIDIDPDHHGMASLRALVDEHGQMPAGPRVRTGSGGWHLYYQHPGQPIKNSAGTHFGSGIDVRGDGGYVIAPPSHHQSGSTYDWHTLDLPAPELPDWAFARITRLSSARASRSSDVRPVVVSDAWARAALNAEAHSVLTAVEGARNHTLNRAAFCLGQIVATGALDLNTVEAALLTSACHVGLGEPEALRTLRSGLTAGMNHPRRSAAEQLASVARQPQTPVLDVGIEIG